MITRPGEYDMSNAEYHAHPAIGSTGLKHFLSDCPARYADMKRKTAGTGGVVADELSFGSAWHTRMLEPEKFADDVVEQPEGMVRRGKDWERFFRRNAHRTILRPGGIETLEAMASAWTRPEHSTALGLLAGPGPAERSFFWLERDTMCKCRVDKLRPDIKTAIDLKSAVDAGLSDVSHMSFRKILRKKHYDLSAVWYQRGLLSHYGENFDFVWIAQEKTKPHRIAVYRISDELFGRGLEKVEKAFGLYCGCLESGRFPGYPNEIVDI